MYLAVSAAGVITNLLALLVQFFEVMGFWVLPSTIATDAPDSPWMSTSESGTRVTIPDYAEEARERAKELMEAKRDEVLAVIRQA